MTETPSGGVRAATRFPGVDAPTHLLVGAAGILGGAVLAYLVAAGLPEFAFALLCAVPIAYLTLRSPQAVVAIWIVVAPFVVLSGWPFRPLYWVFHRGLPVIAVAVLLIAAFTRINTQRLPRLGWPEVAMGGYLAASLLSIVYTSDQVVATSLHLYDRVFIPMCLYLVVRLTQPGEKELRWVLPAVLFLLFSQAAIGLLSWVAPDLLPNWWLGRAGTRTTGR